MQKLRRAPGARSLWRAGRRRPCRSNGSLRHQDADGAWGGIQPPWIYSLMALHVEGYALDHPAVAKGLAGLNDPAWRLGRGRSDVRRRHQLAGVGHDARACSPSRTPELAARIFARRSRRPRSGCSPGRCGSKAIGRVKLPDVEPGGWAFEYCNNAFPDIDDTAVALIALIAVPPPPGVQERRGIDEAFARGGRIG